jgi:hypothetical protein
MTVIDHQLFVISSMQDLQYGKKAVPPVIVDWDTDRRDVNPCILRLQECFTGNRVKWLAICSLISYRAFDESIDTESFYLHILFAYKEKYKDRATHGIKGRRRVITVRDRRLVTKYRPTLGHLKNWSVIVRALASE